VAELISQRIRRNARELKLYGLLESADALIARAEQARLGYREFLDLVLEDEAAVLEGRRYQSRLKLAGLPHHKTLDEFDASFQPELDPKRLSELRTLRFIERRVALLIFGPPGVGKSHISVGLAMEALRRGYLVRYTTLDDLVRSLREADALGKLRQRLAHLQRPQLLILDEAGFLPLDRADSNRLFQVINRRYTRGSTIVTSNKSASEWAELFGDEVLATAIRPPPPRRRGPDHKRPFLAPQGTARGAPSRWRRRPRRPRSPRPMTRAGRAEALRSPLSGPLRRAHPQKPPKTVDREPNQGPRASGGTGQAAPKALRPGAPTDIFDVHPPTLFGGA
jgi:DNA replication protein DnaC